MKFSSIALSLDEGLLNFLISSTDRSPLTRTKTSLMAVFAAITLLVLLWSLTTTLPLYRRFSAAAETLLHVKIPTIAKIQNSRFAPNTSNRSIVNDFYYILRWQFFLIDCSDLRSLCIYRYIQWVIILLK